MIVVTDVLSFRTEQEGFHLILLPEVPGNVNQISTEKHVLIATCISMHSDPISTIAETVVIRVRISRVYVTMAYYLY